MTGKRLWNRDFLLLWQGGAFSALGDQAYMVAVMLWAKQATGSGTTVGAIMFAGGITMLLMPFGGVLADRYSRVGLMVSLDLLSGLCVLSLAALFFLLPDNHPFLIPALIGINFLRGICTALFQPVTNALVPDLVPEHSLTRANSLLQTTWRVTILAGQSLGGFLFRVLGAPLLLLIDGISFLLSGVSEMFIREPERERSEAERRKNHPYRDLVEGFRFTGKIRGLRLYMLEASGVNLFLSSLFVCLPFFVDDVLRAPVEWYGYLLGGMGLGAVIGGLVASRFDRPGKLRGTIHILCLVVLSSCLLPLSFVRNPWVALAILIPAWATTGFHQVILATLIQKRTPQEMRGRIFGVLTVIRNGLMPIGVAVFGILIDQVDGGVEQLLFWAGSAGLVIILVAASFPDYRAFFTGDEEEVPLEKS